MHALIYVTEALVHAPKASPNSPFFDDEKYRSATYISACHCRETSNSATNPDSIQKKIKNVQDMKLSAKLIPRGKYKLQKRLRTLNLRLLRYVRFFEKAKIVMGILEHLKMFIDFRVQRFLVRCSKFHTIFRI